MTKSQPLVLVAALCAAFAADGLTRGEQGSTNTGSAAFLQSPDGAISFVLSRAPAGGGGATRLVYDVRFHGAPVVSRSGLGLALQGQDPLGPDLALTGMTPSNADQSYTLPVGKSSTVRDHYNAMTVHLQEPAPRSRLLTLEVRAYDDAVAFRYRVPEQPGLGDVRITNELTEFQLAKDATTYPLILRGYQTSWEDNYVTLPLSAIDPKSIIGPPLLSDLPGTAFVALTEAHLENYAGMYLQHSPTSARTLTARLSPRLDDPAVSVVARTPFETPWRVVMIADNPGRLVESNVILNLNPPSAIADTSWIRPGKAAWDWWSGSQADNVTFRPGMNTATMEHYIDFASRAGLEYMMVDAGWAHRMGAGRNDSNTDITRAQPNIDMPALLDFARSKRVKLWLWAHWSDVDRQMDQAFPLYERWGIAGVKIDFMDRDDQQMVEFYHRVARSAAEHHLMIDFHGAYKPDGLRRTYPNVMTREGVLGLEYNKWSARDTVEHRVMIAFTRMLAGPMDYTPGGFRNVTREQFEARNAKPMVMGTRAHQLALFVVYESPFMMVSDYPGAYEGQPELPFLGQVPVSWDETRVLNARVGNYITIARRHGDEWYVGSIAGSHGASLDIPLGFLPEGNFVADIYSDAPDAAHVPTHTVIEHRPVTRVTTLKTTLIAGGGRAMRIRRAGARQ